MFLSSLTLLLLAVMGCHASDIHYITPSHTAGCAGSEPCFTLDEYILRDDIELFASDSEVRFMPGIHNMSSVFKQHVLIRDRFNITLTGIEISSNGYETVDIVCSNDTGFLFMNVSDLTISNLAFSFCGVGVAPDILNEILFNQTRTFFFFSPLEMVAVCFVNIHSLNMSNVVIQNSTGYGLLGFNILGNSTISDSYFMYNNYYTYTHAPCLNLASFESFFQCTGGNAVLVFSDTLDCPEDHETYILEITSSYFAFGADLVGNLGSGLTIAMGQNSYGMHITVDNATMIGNTATVGANIAIVMYGQVDNSSVNIRNTFSAYSNLHFEPSVLRILTGEFHISAGLYFSYGFELPTGFIPSCSHRDSHFQEEILRVSDSQFLSNNGLLGGGMTLNYDNVDYNGVVHMIIIENTVIADNIGSPGAALFVGQISPIRSVLLAKFLFKNCTFLNNTYPTTDLPNSVQQFEFDVLNAVQLISVEDITFANCSFVNNTGSAIYSYGSNIRFTSENTFDGNSGVNGGAMSLHANTLMLLTRNTTIRYISNSAQFRGGAIFIAGANYRIRSLCFWQIEDEQELGPVVISVPGNVTRELPNFSEMLNISVLFDGNEASEAGTAIYGGNIDVCNLLSTIHLVSRRDSGKIFNQIFRFENSTEINSNSSLISSEPFAVCLCEDNIANCSLRAYSVSVFPGNTFHVSAAAKGQREGLSPAVVYADFVPPFDGQYPPTLGPLQDTQEIGKDCTKLSYSVSSTDASLSMLLAIKNSVLRLEPTYVYITLLDCPPGFILSGSPPMCNCHPDLTAVGVECDLSTQTVIRVAPLWIGKEALNESSETNIIIHEFCPFDYCVQGEIYIDLHQQDMQCSHNRTGILCGACQQHWSLQLGTSECGKCSNYYLFLLIPFALAGIMLVLLLFLLDSLTVSVGTINGLIFYANIVQFNKGIFFPPDDANILTVFIAWLNLDLGIKTCFFKGMDSYSLTWLQFAFPVYILAIVGVIMLLSHYSSIISKLFGKNVVPVLATLLLLSFSKLQRTLIKALSFTSIEHSDDTVSVAWLYDANIEFLAGSHIPLFVVAIIIGLFISVPFILVLLCSPCLLAKSSHRPFKWVNKMKPFFDAYQGPYKDKFRNWTGFLLIIRVTVFVIFSFNVSGPDIILLVIVVLMQAISFFSWIGGGVYKNWPLNVLEFSFFLNLGVLSTASLFLQLHSGSKQRQVVLVYISVSIALLEFIGIIVYAIYSRILLCWQPKEEGESVPRKTSLLLLGKQFGLRRSSDKPEEQCDGRSREMVTVTELVRNEDSEDFSIRLREPFMESTQLPS